MYKICINYFKFFELNHIIIWPVLVFFTHELLPFRNFSLKAAFIMHLVPDLSRHLYHIEPINKYGDWNFNLDFIIFYQIIHNL